MSISLHGPDYLVDEDAVGVVLDGVWYMKYIWSAEPSILTFGHMGAPLDFDGDTDRLERTFDVLGERTTGIEMEEGVTESARS